MKEYLAQTILMAVLVLGALGQQSTTYLLFQLTGIVFLVSLAFRNGRARTPPGFFLYLLFLAILVWKFLEGPYQTDLHYLYLFAGGGALWFTGYNLQTELGKPFGKLIISLGLLMGVLYLAVLVQGSTAIIPGSIFAASSVFKNHNHIGDLWAVVLLFGVDRFRTKKSIYFWGLLALGFYFLFASYSRSALLAFVAGLVYLFSGKHWQTYKYLFICLVLAALAILFLTSIGKTIFFSRPYFSQATWGLIHHPEGVGMGNFRAISSRFEVGTYSSIVHNIVLEVLVGVGWLGLVFAAWLGVEIKKVLFQGGTQKIYQSVFLAITLNFMFDSTYAIPTMIWLWFLSLGLSHARHSRG